MTDHAWILDNVATYLTGGLEASERERFEQHVTACASCAAAVHDARRMDATLTDLFADVRPRPTLEDGVIQALRTRKRASLHLPLPGWLALSAAALTLIALTGAAASQWMLEGGLAFPVLTSAAGEDRSSKTEMVFDEVKALFSADFETFQRKSAGSRQFSSGGRHSGVSNGWSKEPLGESPPASPATDMNGQPQNNLFFSDGSARLAQSISQPWAYIPLQPPGGGAAVAGGGLPATDFPSNKPSSSTKPSQAPSHRGFLPSTLLDDYIILNSKQPLDQKKLPEAAKPQDAEKSGLSLGRGEGGGKGRVTEGKESLENAQTEKQPAPDKQQPPPAARRIVIRTGDIEYEVASFDAAVATIARLVNNIKGSYVSTVNSDKLENGKVRGSVVVRVPPDHLDALLLELRANLGKNGELKKQNVKSLEITKEYTDLESELRAAKAMEERLLQIIKSGKGEIKDLLAAEKELGNWRKAIERVEGNLRYFANQVALSTLTISLVEKEIEAAYGVIERERVLMGVVVEEVDRAFQAAQKAVREVKGRITRSELKQHSPGQFGAVLHFEVSPDAAGPLRDRLRQMGTATRLDVTREEVNEGGTGKPSDGRVKRRDTRFEVSFYNLMNVEPRETVVLSVACLDVEAAMKTLLERVEKAAGRVVVSRLNSMKKSEQTNADLNFQVKSTLAEAVLADVKSVGEVMSLQTTENPDVQNTTRQKRGFQVRLWALEAAMARETDTIQLACADVAASYRAVQDAVAKVKGRVRSAQFNEQDRRNVTASLDFDVRRTEEAGVRAALSSAGDTYTLKTSRAADGDGVVDSKVRYQVTFLNQANIPPRETYAFTVEVADVDHTSAMVAALVGEHQGRVLDASVLRDSAGRVTGKLIVNVPLAKARELIEQLKSTGTIRGQQSSKHSEVPDNPLAVARLDVTLSNAELIVPTDNGFGASVRHGLGDSFAVLSWSIRILILGLCVLLPWALVILALYRIIARWRRRTA